MMHGTHAGETGRAGGGERANREVKTALSPDAASRDSAHRVGRFERFIIVQRGES